MQNTRPVCSKSNWKSPGNPIHNQLTKIQVRPQVTETVRKLELVPEVSFDNNKNYAKSINRLLNGTKVSKKLILDDNDDDTNEVLLESSKPSKSKGQIKNGLLGKRKQKCLSRNMLNTDEVQNVSSCHSTTVDVIPVTVNEKLEERRVEENECVAVENIAERIKRRKVTMEAFKKNEDTSEINRKSTRSRGLNKRVTNDCVEIEEEEKVDIKEEEQEEEKVVEEEEKELPIKSRRKEVKVKRGARRKNNKITKTEVLIETESVDRTSNTKNKMAKRATRNSIRLKTYVNNNEELDNENSIVNNETIDVDLDERVMQDQERIERLVRQEKKDYELAQRLQAKFNEMERISGRTRGSKRALERDAIAINNINNDKTSKGNGKSVNNNSAIIPTSTAKSRRRQKRD